jgi:hypothetical protein
MAEILTHGKGGRRPEGVAAYWRRKNLMSIDGKATGLLDAGE